VSQDIDVLRDAITQAAARMAEHEAAMEKAKEEANRQGTKWAAAKKDFEEAVRRYKEARWP
jgi:hypothetical protein